MPENHLPIVKAAESKTILEAALSYATLGFSVLPLIGKRPSLASWANFQKERATPEIIRAWHTAGQLQNVGLVCGAISNNLVVLDLDGAAGYPAFAAMFPHLVETYTVASGGGTGRHVYWQVAKLPPAVKAMSTPIGNLEICAEGRQVVAPPSLHPTTQQPYRVEKALSILQQPDLAELIAWIESFKTAVPTKQWQPPTTTLTKGNLNPQVIETLAQHFAALGYKQHGDWLHGQCVYPYRHKNGDRHPSFGFNTASGFGYCYKCGTILAKDLCASVGIDPGALGGIILKPASAASASNSVQLSDAPEDAPPVTVSSAGQPPKGDLVLENLNLPRWLKTYLEWAGATGNQTPMSFHLAAGVWLLSITIGRRLYGAAPWGINLYPNLYVMLIAGTTYYRKSTAYKLAEQVARAAIPHMFMPTPGSPERFQEALSGRLPANFDKLTSEQQARFTQAQPFAAQRGLLKDEIAGLFGAINKRDYMQGV